jgi:pSer/pThr/pTyr-binding forkhead associated (FHA) protein
MATLFISQPDGSEVEFPLSEASIRIGRAKDNDLHIPDESVSTFHAEILIRDGNHVVKDLGSTNGVRVNGERVQEAPITDGDIVRFGNVRARYQSDAADAIAEPADAVEIIESAGQAAEIPVEIPATGAPAAVAPVSLPASPPAAAHSDVSEPTGPLTPVGFGPKKSAKDPEKSLYIVIAAIVALTALAAAFLSFTM